MSNQKHPITADEIAKVAELVATAEPAVAYRAIDDLAQHVFGHRLLTILAYRPETVEVERLYSSNETAYPVFFDHELIASLGISGMINIPLLLSGRCVGTLNISNVAGHFSEADFPTARILAALTLPLVLGKA
jgi:hypothetical protein